MDSIQVAQNLVDALGLEYFDDLVDLRRPSSRQPKHKDVISTRLREELAWPWWLGPSELNLDRSESELERLRQVWWHAPYRIAEMDHGLRKLLPVVRRRRRRTVRDEAVEGYTVEVLNLARSFLTFVGERQLALIVAERAATQTTHPSSPVAAAAVRGLALSYLQNKHYTTALTLSLTQAKRISARTPLLRGSLLSIAAKAAAQLHDRRQTTALIRLARQAATRLGQDTHEHGVWFGPADIALTEMSVAWIIGEHDRVLTIAERFPPPETIPPHIRMPFHALIAALYARRNDIGTSMLALREVERLSPEALIYNQMVREALRTLSGSSHPLLGHDLRRMIAAAEL